ncbi:uncharacterized protein LOC144151751 [Haemaphysalis longicornis]
MITRPVSTPFGHSVVVNAERLLLQARILDCKAKIRALENNVFFARRRLEHRCPIEFARIQLHSKQKTELQRQRADKGNATVLLDKADYENEMLLLPEDSETYVRLKKDPTLKVEREFQKLLADVFLSVPPNHKALYYRLLSHNGSAPALYGLPKIHNPDVPMRPIVDYTRSPLHSLSKFLHQTEATSSALETKQEREEQEEFRIAVAAAKMTARSPLINVPDDAVRVAVAPYGRVGEVRKERWRVNAIQDKGSLRSVTLKLKAGVTVDDLPHEFRVAGDKALVVVSGRAPQCLRCNTKGHIRRECKVPKCSLCRRFGHEASACGRSYATVTGPARDDELRENLMDEADAEDTAAGTSEVVSESAPAVPVVAKADRSVPAKELLGEPKTPTSRDSSRKGSSTKAASQEKGATPTTLAPAADVTNMEVGGDGSGGAAAKRQRDGDDNSQSTEVHSTEEPPTKAVPGRRTSFKPKSNVPPDRTKPPGDRAVRKCRILQAIQRLRHYRPVPERRSHADELRGC